MSQSGDGRRVARVENEVQRVIAQYLIAHLNEELPGLITVSRVRMPADLRTAKVYVSALFTEEDGDLEHQEKLMEEILETLQDRASEIQSAINKHLRMRYCPKLTFFKDDVTDHVLKIEGLIHELKKEKKDE